MRTDNIGEGKSRRDLIESKWIITGKESLHWDRFFELAQNSVICGHKNNLFKKPKGEMAQKFFSASVVYL